MSRRTKQPATSRRTRRAEHPPQPVAVGAEAQRRVVVSNPIFYCGARDQQDGGGASEWRKPPAGDQLLLRRVVYDDGEWKAPLPLPPCRAHRAARVGPACAVVGTQGAGVVSWRGHGRHQQDQQDPFLAAYVACSKSSSSSSSGSARAKRQHGEKERKNKKMNGWAAGAKYAASMSCKNGCTVNNNARARYASSVSMAKKEPEAEAPTLDLSWAPVVLATRARERRREQR